jgi:hypothetical protein
MASNRVMSQEPAHATRSLRRRSPEKQDRTPEQEHLLFQSGTMARLTE